MHQNRTMHLTSLVQRNAAVVSILTISIFFCSRISQASFDFQNLRNIRDDIQGNNPGNTAATTTSRSEPQSLFSEEFSSFLENLNKRYVIIQFWSAYCPPCGEEVGELNRLLKATLDLKDSNDSNQNWVGLAELAIIGVPIDRRRSDTVAFTNHFRPEYPQWIAKSDSREPILTKEMAVPLVILTGKKEGLIRRWTGKISMEAIIAELNQIQRKE